jgi:hypothetical protein
MTASWNSPTAASLCDSTDAFKGAPAPAAQITSMIWRWTCQRAAMGSSSALFRGRMVMELSGTNCEKLPHYLTGDRLAIEKHYLILIADS